MNTFIKGMDISTLMELENLGAKYYNNDKEEDLLHILKDYDVNYIRLRLWNDPYSEKGEPYGAGSNDLEVTLSLAKRALALGLGFLLDFHYSDFWTDPGKQTIPKAWQGYNREELAEAVYSYTLSVLTTLKEANAFPTMIQIGNEITNGLLWPYGKVPNYDGVALYINAGIRAVRAIDREVPIMLHLDNGGNNSLYRDWFDNYMQRGEDFQYIGLSYYPFWHGSLKDLEYNMNDIAKRYGKELIVAEVSMGYTLEDYKDYENLESAERKGMATKPALAEKIDHPMTKEGQCSFLEDFLSIVASTPEDKGAGFFYWEPGWLPVPGSGWATEAALSYIKEKGPGGNEWANQALFDYEGNALPSLRIIRDFRK